MVPRAALALSPKVLLRSVNGEPLFESPWVYGAVRVAALATFFVFAAILYLNSKA
jgi:hypothetical protein